MTVTEILAVEKLAPFDFRWPDGTESFETGWSFEVRANGRRHAARHGLGAREVYGRLRVHTVTWIDGQVQVEGVEADDYPTSQALISRLRRPGRATARRREEVPSGYEGFEIVEHRREIDAPYSPQCLAVKRREDDLASWALHAWLRSQLPRNPSAATPSARRPGPGTQGSPELSPPPPPDAQAVARALLAHDDALASQLKDAAIAQFTPNQEANQLIHDDPFAFLLAVISDMGIPAERAWRCHTSFASVWAASPRSGWPPIPKPSGPRFGRSPCCTGSSTMFPVGWSRHRKSSSTNTTETPPPSGLTPPRR